MPNVTVNPINTVSVRVNQQNQKIVHNTSTFVGAADVQQQVNQIQQLAQQASDTANTALSQVDSKYDKTGGTITGNVEITGNLYVDEIINANNETIDAGIF
jgi:predicted ATP-grasp superfamily ATP-dependent carboligase